MLIAIPAFRLSCNVGIDKGRAWSVIDELVLWATGAQARSISQLAGESGLPRQIIVASIARLMRFRLIELSVQANGASFRASAYGREVISSGQALPFFPKREMKRVSFVIDQATGGFFPAGQVRMLSATALANEADPDVRKVVVEGGGPSMSHEANLARLSRIAARGWEEQVALVDGRTASLRSEYMMIRVVDGVPRNVPETASQTLRQVIDDAASLPTGTTQVAVGYGGPKPLPEPLPTVHQCEFDPDDLVIGGSAQLECLKSLLARADKRVIIHSTFLDHRRFREVFPDIRAACLRGVTFDLLWGAESIGEDEDNRNGASAVEIAKIVREDRDVYRRFHVHMRSTGSHAKILLADTADGNWIAAVGSCNWLSSPFRAVDITVILRDPSIVADVVVAVQRMVGRRGLSDDIATEMAIVSRDLRRIESRSGPAQISLVIGDGHDTLMRHASGNANRRVVVGSHRLGSTARPGFVLQAEAAVERAKVDVTLIYTMPSGPLKKRHARKLVEEAADNGVRLLKATIPLHGKFLAWDDNDLVVTSLNWASAASDDDFPQADIGLHITAQGIAAHANRQLEAIFPELGMTLGAAPEL